MTNPNAIRLRGFGTIGLVSFQAQDSFDAVLDAHHGSTFGAGGQLLLPWGLYAEVGVWQFKQDGERAFVGPNREVFKLGIPLEVTITPVEVTGGWRYRHCPPPPAPPRKPQPPPAIGKPPAGKTPPPPPAPPRATTPASSCAPRFIPYAGGGFSSYRYRETSEFSDASENIDERFNGFHLVGGAEYRVLRWAAVGGEVMWSTVPDALGAGGVSAAFDEDNLGGTAIRLKITLGR